jgi:hypothetical protein
MAGLALLIWDDGIVEYWNIGYWMSKLIGMGEIFFLA